MRRVDANQPEIVAALRKFGCSVEPRVAQIGHGVPDLLVGFAGLNHLIEVKDGNKPPSKKKLTPDEEKWHSLWRGRVVVINSVEQAVEWLNGIREAGL